MKNMIESKKVITDKYNVIRSLGNGASAEVKEAIDVETDEKVALKVFSHRNFSRKRMERFWTEINAMKSVSHPSVLQFKDYNTDMYWIGRNGDLFNSHIISMEFAANGDLFNLVSKTGGLQERFAKKLSFQLLSGLEALHAVGVCHRDIKPENLILDANFDLKIADFGYAHIFDPLQDGRCYTRCGTHQYMAPEVTGSQSYDGKKYDVWSAGVVCFILNLGHPPFASASLSDWWFLRIAQLRYEDFWKAHFRKGKTKSLSNTGMRFLNKCLVADPESRASVGDLLKDAWFSLVADESYFEYDADYTEEMRSRLIEDREKVN